MDTAPDLGALYAAQHELAAKAIKRALNHPNGGDPGMFKDAVMTVAVAATTAGVGVATNTQSSLEATFGTADILLSLPGSDPSLAGMLAR